MFDLAAWWRDLTKRFKKKNEIDSTHLCQGKAAIALFQVDNMDEVIRDMDKPDKMLLGAGVGKLLEKWGEKCRAYIQKYEEDKYLIIFDKSRLGELEEDKFSILSKVRSLNFGNTIPLTISIGIGAGIADFASLGEYAETALSIALGRGGDQVVIKEREDLRFYGAKTQAVEKRSQVKVRVMARALANLICQANRVVVSGHFNMDYDSLASCLAVLRICRTYGKAVRMMIDDPPSSAFYKFNKMFNLLEEYDDVFLTKDEVLKWMLGDTLLIIVDTHKADILPNPEIVKVAQKIVVLDHHRQAGEFSYEPVLVYLEPSSSSVSEILTEIINYLPDVKLTKVEANALLAGIMLDTKNFLVQTGARTFEAASRLRNWDADPLLMRRLFKKDMGSILAQVEVVKNVEILYNAIAVGTFLEESPNAQIMAAQAADSLVNIEEIEASFVISKGPNGAVISARSAGNANVQVIMESMGGGGHLLMAAAQCPGITVEEAKAALIPIIEAYWKEW